jgi:LysR family transcriptional regulator, glycine cleavage system transcriptional activator
MDQLPGSSGGGYRGLPSLMALRAFEAAGRHESFSRAAEELLLTQSAISRHIRHLEEDLGTRLFWRKGRQVGLTDDGKALHLMAGRAFAQLTEGIAALRRRNGPLTISMLPSVAAR